MCDAYKDVCENFPRLCPRLTPQPLSYYTLKSFSKLNPYVSTVICEDCDDTVRRLNYFWLGQRGDTCEVCGSKGEEIDEEWEYCLDGDKGLARLVGLRTLCRKCYSAKYRAMENRPEALTHLAEVNGVNDVEEGLRRAFEVQKRLSSIEDWAFELEALEGELRDKAERLMNTAFKGGLSYEDGWLYYTGKNSKVLVTTSLEKTLNIIKSYEDLYSLAVSSLDGEAQVLEKEFKFFLDMVKIPIRIVLDVDDRDFALRSLKESVSGKWMVFVRQEVYVQFFKRVIGLLGDDGYRAKITCNLDKDELPVIVYVPSAFDFENVLRVKGVLTEVMEEFDVNKNILFKPDVFSANEIYSGRSDIKPYIYVALSPRQV
ncbi:hypothetical protein [Stygiolobus caldivivus]|uniref:Uncharacterized protein n=1 Tax=Stygiolobus caldivivus TaxID=2824673 RepID=A0A8D5U6W1_9CREN|nr:hypothetical protein [Stygiolobus caldivivus]BCU69924.1 hypothetical protein KN1_12210 [Stygiolobus caldivivus]